VLSSSATLFWGLQFAFLNPALVLLLVALYDASAADVGWVLALYNASGFLAAVLVPAWADRHHNYLRPLLICGSLTFALAAVLAIVSALPAAVVALTVLGGPAGVGVSLLFADPRHSGAAPSEVINTRAVVSTAWVAGPPAATFIMGAFGAGAILPVLAAGGPGTSAPVSRGAK
jgi:SET family sugar efflux transporter-like MFS transporter